MTAQRAPVRPHPVKGEIVMRGIRLGHVASCTGYHHAYFRRVVAGAVTASPEFRRRVSTWLDMPEDELFLDDAELFAEGMT